jgi:hypothetical protein
MANRFGTAIFAAAVVFSAGMFPLQAKAQSGCTDCNGIPEACMQGCLVKVNGNPGNNISLWNTCMNDCINTQYVPCVQAQAALTPEWSYAGPTMLICNIDSDLHLDGVTVELYTADRYQDVSCRNSADQYHERKVVSVHCGFSSQGTCTARVTSAIEQLVAQGYTVTVAAAGQDNCPWPH